MEEENKNTEEKSETKNLKPETKSKINYDDFKKVEIRVGQIKSAEKVADADRLLKLQVDFGDETRQIISGIAEYFREPEKLIDRKVAFVTNLEARIIRGEKSDGMIMAALDREEQQLSLLEIDSKIPVGTYVS